MESSELEHCETVVAYPEDTEDLVVAGEGEVMEEENDGVGDLVRNNSVSNSKFDSADLEGLRFGKVGTLEFITKAGCNLPNMDFFFFNVGAGRTNSSGIGSLKPFFLQSFEFTLQGEIGCSPSKKAVRGRDQIDLVENETPSSLDLFLTSSGAVLGLTISFGKLFSATTVQDYLDVDHVYVDLLESIHERVFQ